MNADALASDVLIPIIKLEGEKSREEIAGFIVGELVGDYDNKYQALLETNLVVQHIADLASDLEWSEDLVPRPTITSLLGQSRTSYADNKAQMLEPFERTVLS